jgi:hypothetical protein
MSFTDSFLSVKNRTTAGCSTRTEDSQAQYFKCTLSPKRIDIFEEGFSVTDGKHGPMAVCQADRIVAAGPEDEIGGQVTSFWTSLCSDGDVRAENLAFLPGE